jgi:hypothetical protein
MIFERERACDDYVLLKGVEPASYASVLLSITSTLSKCPSSLGGVAMSQRPIEKRLRAILDAAVCRNAASTLFQGHVWSFFACLCLVIAVLRPFDPSSAIQTESGRSDSTVAETTSSGGQETKSLMGNIVDENGKPISGAVVEFSAVEFLTDRYQSNHPKTRPLKQTTVKSGDDGSFEIRHDIDVAPETISIGLTVSAEAHWQYRHHVNSKKALENGQLGKITLGQGRLVTGKLKSPQRDGVALELRNPIVELLAIDYSINFHCRLRCEPNGDFKVLVPKETPLHFFARSDNSGEVRTKIGPFDEHLGDIELPLGTSVAGKLVDENDRPMPAVVVQLTAYQDRGGGNKSEEGRWAVKTDGDGQFRLPPHKGKAAIGVVVAGRERDELSLTDEIHSDSEPPTIMPVDLDLDGAKPEVALTLKSGPTSNVTGIIRWADGNPAAGIGVSGLVMAGGVGSEVTHALSDEQGRYSVRFPTPAKWCPLQIMSQRDAHGGIHRAHMEPHEAASTKGSSLDVSNGNLENVN